MGKVLRIVSGLSLSIVFSTFQFTQSKIQQYTTNWVIFQDIFRLAFIFLFSSILIIFKGSKLASPYPLYLLFVAALTDYLGILFLNYSFRIAPEYFIFFLDALIYPMDTLYSVITSNITVNILPFVLFCLLVTLVFYNGFHFSNEKFSKKFSIGFIYMMLSNLSFLINIHSQYIICEAIGMPGYYLRYVPITFGVGLLVSIITDWKNRPQKNQIFQFYKTNSLYLLLCGISGAGFYILSTLFIEKYHTIYFNIANLPSSSISGLINLIFFTGYKENKIRFLKQSLVYLLVIVIGGIMLGVG